MIEKWQKIKSLYAPGAFSPQKSATLDNFAWTF